MRRRQGTTVFNRKAVSPGRLHCAWALAYSRMARLSLGVATALLLAGKPCAATEAPQRILILNSYHETYPWTASEVHGIREVLQAELDHYELNIEYLDSKRIIRTDYVKLLVDVFRMKYTGIPLDVIISTDDNALTFLLQNRDIIFGPVPVVFCGVDDASESRVRGMGNLTGVVETLDIQETLETALRLFPNTLRVHVLSDGSPTGRAQRESIEAVEPRLPNLRFKYLNGEDMTHESLFNKLRQLPPERGIVLLAAWEQDRTGSYMPLERVRREIASNSALPVFVLTDSRLGGGTLGGKLARGRLHGNEAGRLAVRVLKGEPADSIPVEATRFNTFAFDYQQLPRWGITVDDLPAGSILFNRPDSFYSRHYRAIWTLIGVLVFLVSVILVLTANILKRRRAEAALRSAMLFNQEVISNAGEGILVCDRDHRYVLWNPFMEQLTGLSSPEVLARRGEDLFPHVLEQKTNELIERALAGERVPPAEIAFRVPATGKQGWVLNTYGPIRDAHGQVVGTVAIVHDITERKRTEAELENYRNHLEELVKARTAELEAVNRELEAFSYSVSHDLRAPLRAMDGFSQALLEDYRDRLDDQGKNYLERVRNASQRMGHLIDDLLKLSRITRAEMRVEEVDLSALAEEIVDELRRGQPERSVTVTIEPALKVRGDPRLLRVLLTNLLGNAWKFTGKAADARIEFRQERTDGQIVYCIRDNGAGFDQQYAGKLFGAFQRLHATTEFEGTGIGLATSQRIVHRHGGRIWAEGEVGRGATFRFRLE